MAGEWVERPGTVRVMRREARLDSQVNDTGGSPVGGDTAEVGDPPAPMDPASRSIVAGGVIVGVTTVGISVWFAAIQSVLWATGVAVGLVLLAGAGVDRWGFVAAYRGADRPVRGVTRVGAVLLRVYDRWFFGVFLTYLAFVAWNEARWFAVWFGVMAAFSLARPVIRRR